jgi:hypothetical protein
LELKNRKEKKGKKKEKKEKQIRGLVDESSLFSSEFTELNNKKLAYKLANK